MIDTATQAMKGFYGFIASILTAPLAIIVNVVGQIQDAIGGINATFIALLSSLLLIFTIRGRILDNKRKILENKKLQKELDNE